jgi:hypothetical protein
MIRLVVQKWLLLKEKLTMGLFGLSGSLTAGSIYHVVQTCQGGDCIRCGRCAVALSAAVASASAGIAGRTKGRRRWVLIAAVVFIGMLIYGLLELLKSGILKLPA